MDSGQKPNDSKLEVDIQVSKGFVNKLIVRITESDKCHACSRCRGHCCHGDHSPRAASSSNGGPTGTIESMEEIGGSPSQSVAKVDYSKEEGDDKRG